MPYCDKVSCSSLTGESRQTGAVVVADEVDARGTVEALSHTVVDVEVTVTSRPAFATLALVTPLAVLAGHGVDARFAGHRGALVHV